MAPRPPGVSAVPVAASVMRAYWQSALGNAMTGSETSEFLRMQNASMASFGSGPPLYPESLRVNRNKGAAIIAKIFICVLKKLQSPMKEQIVFTSVGGLTSLITLNLFFLGLIPAGVSVNPRKDTSLFPK